MSHLLSQMAKKVLNTVMIQKFAFCFYAVKFLYVVELAWN